MKFREAQAEIEQWVEKSRTGETNLAYVDEAGFAQAQPNRTAWTEKGEVHLITAERGKRLNVLGALISNGTLFTAKFWETTTAAAFGGFLGPSARPPIAPACSLPVSLPRRQMV